MRVCCRFYDFGIRIWFFSYTCRRFYEYKLIHFPWRMFIILKIKCQIFWSAGRKFLNICIRAFYGFTVIVFLISFRIARAFFFRSGSIVWLSVVTGVSSGFVSTAGVSVTGASVTGSAGF